ncbi:MAG: hypothetical protein LBM19_00855 [Holosporales bacterium]|jgi:hypothetical protein|nr:hypothetical protein [Holosporales bacterium]
MQTIKFGLLIALLNVFTTVYPAKFEASHLPLAGNISASFPKLKATCFIIANKETSLVLHEKNSRYKIHGGAFGDLIASPYGDEEKTTLYDMCEAFAESFDSLRNKPKLLENINGVEICFFKSPMSGVGCAFKYKNKNSCGFFCALYGLSTKEEAINDAKSIANWLDQFFVFNASKQGELIAEVPVFCGEQNRIKLTISEDHNLLTSQNYSKQITKISRYRTAVAAPINEDDNLGAVFYATEIFQNPVVRQLTSDITIKKADVTKVVKDSFAYLIFGASYYEQKRKISIAPHCG